MGNCNGLPSSFYSTTTTNTRPSNGITVHSPEAVLGPRPQPDQPHPDLTDRASAGAVGRVLGKSMEDVRETYEFGRELGRGQFGVTYLATHKETGQQFACKSIATRKLINRDDIDDVRREVQIMHHLTGHRYLRPPRELRVFSSTRYIGSCGSFIQRVIQNILLGSLFFFFLFNE